MAYKSAYKLNIMLRFSLLVYHSSRQAGGNSMILGLHCIFYLINIWSYYWKIYRITYVDGKDFNHPLHPKSGWLSVCKISRDLWLLTLVLLYQDWHYLWKLCTVTSVLVPRGKKYILNWVFHLLENRAKNTLSNYYQPLP